MARLDGHRTAELRSLAYHRHVAKKLCADPNLMVRARAKLDADLADAAPGSGAAHYARGWLRRLDGSRAELLEFLTSDSQEARDFRQASPFAGALSARERWQLWRDAAKSSIGTER
jgi:hypothetical protein